MSAKVEAGAAVPRVFTIPSGVPFLDALVAGLRDRFGAASDDLAGATVLLPTRRSVLSLRDAFLRQSDGQPLLLPTMLPLGDIDEDELILQGGDEFDLDLPPAISPLRRQLLLMNLVQKMHALQHDEALAAVQAAPLAAELAAFLDLMQREDVALDRLQDLVPERYAAHWQQTLTFLQVLEEPWRGLLAAEGTMDPVARRNRVIRARAEQWQAAPPAGPVIAAGTTGSMPATADLLAVVAALPAGMVVLPGLDRELDDASWAALADDHPQFGMRQLLSRLRLGRDGVADWLDGSHSPAGRIRLVQEALRPSETTEGWNDLPVLPADTGEGLSRIDCAGEQQEALAIALAMRRTLEVPERTAALITPDRGLARRVATELKRWNVDVDDSAGVPLMATPPAVLLRLSAEAVAEGMAPIPLLALLKHPLSLSARPPGMLRRLARLLDRAVLRGPRLAPGLAPMRDVLREAKHEDRAAALELLDDLERQAGPLVEALADPRHDLTALLEAHVALAEWLACDEAGATQLWRGEAGEALGKFLNELMDAADQLPPVETAGYPAFLTGLMTGLAVRPRYGQHPRLSIWGPLEARLQQADLLILGGLNEGTWPAVAEVDAWLSRPMRADLGLPAPERRIGLAAHDFVQAATAPRVLLTRADRVGGSPTVPSRWLLRLERVMAKAGLSLSAAEDRPLPHWADTMQDAGEPRPVDPPAVRPPVAARPRELAATRIELWMRDPYAIYARYILRLKALEPIAADAGAAERGNAIHDALDAFVGRYRQTLPHNAREELLRIGEEAFGPLLDRPGVRAFWWPRFLRVVDWFVDHEMEHRETHTVLVTEAEGERTLPGPAGPFKLTAKADRIDSLADGRLAIIDYKTGVVPKGTEIKLGISPQLPLEAIIASEGGFANVPAQPVAELAYWKLSGGRVRAEIHALKGDAMAAANTALEGLVRLIAEFDNPGTPYRARPRPAAAPRFSDYDHLARVKEWSAGGPGDW